VSVQFSSVIECLHDPANVQHYICWKFAGRLLDRVNIPLRRFVVSLPSA